MAYSELQMERSIIMQETSDAGHGGLSVCSRLPAKSTFGSEFRLKCPMCLQDLKKPKQLPSCFHIFCADCLKDLIVNPDDEKVVCPACHMTSSTCVVSKAVNSDDTYLHAFRGLISVYAESGNIECFGTNHTGTAQASYFCLDCGKNLCDTCHHSHIVGETFTRNHHCLRLFEIPTTMAVDLHQCEKVSSATFTSLVKLDETDAAMCVKCPLCRNTRQCEHECHLRDLLNSDFMDSDRCLIPTHIEGNRLIAYCGSCEKPICRNCSMIEHRDHTVMDIGSASVKRLKLLKSVRQAIAYQYEKFDLACKAAQQAEIDFKHHIVQMEREMISRKGAIQAKVEEAFNMAFGVIEQMGEKTVALDRKSSEMQCEAEFFQLALRCSRENIQEGCFHPLHVVRTWKVLSFIMEAMQRRSHSFQDCDDNNECVPQHVVVSRLVLPAPNCMDPNLSILQLVGVEQTIIRKAFVLPAEAELLIFYSLLPLTENEVLLSCKTEALTSSVVQYSKTSKNIGVKLKDDGQYCIISVPGNGIVATLYQADIYNRKGKKQVLFWDQALDRSITEIEAQNAGDELKPFYHSRLPPRAVAITRNNHLVVCTADDEWGRDQDGSGGNSCVILMTMRGDVLASKLLPSPSLDTDHDQYFPRYVTVNINGDICITDEVQQSVTIFNDRLELIHTFHEPYNDDFMNKRFCPMGICHDNYGRLIIADANNDAVIRLEFGHGRLVSRPEIVLRDGQHGLQDFYSPTLVAVGPGNRLWVVCRAYIHAFDYMTPLNS